MKKRIFSLFLVLSVMMTTVIVPAQAENPQDMVTDTSDVCPCGCGQILDQINWKKWDPNVMGNPVDSHYYLDGDYSLDSNITFRQLQEAAHKAVL